MKIGVNLLAFQPDRIGGLEHYVRRLLALLLEQTTDSFVLFLAPGVDGGFAESTGRLRLRPFDLAEGDLALARAMGEEGIDLWWCPWVVWRPLRPPVPVVVTVPDIQHEHLPDAFTPEERRERRVDYLVAVHCAHAVITFSNHTRDDVRRLYGAPDERVFAIHLDAGYDWAASAPSPALVSETEAKVGRGFLYYPANTWPHKDHATLLAALRRLADGGERHRLVLTGAGDRESARLRDSIRELGLAQSVDVLGTVSPAEVRALYGLASAVVFPSRFEGFGMPLVEGMRSGVPVLASDATSLPEIGGDGVDYFHAGDVDDLAAKIRRITRDETWRSELVARGAARAARFSYESTARATADVFAFALRSRPPDTPVATALRGVADRLLSALAVAVADAQARLDLIERMGAAAEACEADRAARLEVIEQMKVAAEACEADRAARLEVIEQMKVATEACEADRAAQRKVIERMATGAHAGEADRASQREVIERMKVAAEAGEADRAAQREVIERMARAAEASEADRASQREVIERMKVAAEASDADRASQREVIERMARAAEASEADRASQREVIERMKVAAEAGEADRAAQREVIERMARAAEAGEADRASQREVIERMKVAAEASEADRAARLDLIERMMARVREAYAVLQAAEPRSYHGLAWPRDVLRARNAMEETLRLLRDLV